MLLRRSWSPSWKFGKDDFETTARSFDNPDFATVVISNYRRRHGNMPRDPSYSEQERLLAKTPRILVPSVVLVLPEKKAHRSLTQMHLFPKGTRRIVVPGAGHFVLREKPHAAVETNQTLTSQA